MRTRLVYYSLGIALTAASTVQAQSDSPAPSGNTQKFSADSSAEASAKGEELNLRTIHRRAVEAAIWGMPIVSVDWMRNGFFQNGAKYGDILYFSKPADWKFQITTPNASTNYVYFNYNVKDGPWVLEFPA